MVTRILLFVVVALLVLAGGTFTALQVRRPAMTAPSTMVVDRSAARIERGRYLFETVSACGDCHSPGDWTRFGGPVAPANVGKGRVMPEAMGLPGTIVAPNLTSDAQTGAARWSDGQLMRAIREGIGHDDRPLFPLMPYADYASMSDEDVQALVAFIRTLPPVVNPLPPTRINFPVNLLIKSAPKPVGKVPAPDRGDPVAYGRYLTRIAGCQSCHTPNAHGEIVEEELLSGGREFPFSDAVKVVSANITPDTATGIGQLTEEQFLDKFYQYKEYAEKGSPVVPLANNTVMPWLGYARFEPADLRAIYAFLRTVPARRKSVVTHPDAEDRAGQAKKG